MQMINDTIRLYCIGICLPIPNYLIKSTPKILNAQTLLVDRGNSKRAVA